MKKIEAMLNNLLKSCLEERKLLEIIVKEAHQEKIPVIDRNTGSFLELICVLTDPENILEIGCGIGFSSYFLIKNLKKGNYTGIDLNKDRVKRAEEFMKKLFHGKSFRFLAGNALEIIPKIEGKFDMVFIDGAKFEYPLYLKIIESKLKKGAIIVADNIFYKDKIFMDTSKIKKHDLNSVRGIKEYIRHITSKKYFKNYFYKIGDGISITVYKNFTILLKK